MNNNEYIRLSLELHLFFDRIMKEHSLFLEAAFIEKNNDLKLIARQFQNSFNDILKKIVQLANNNVGDSLLSSNEIVTKDTYLSEIKTSNLSGIPIDLDVTSSELSLRSGSVVVNDELVNVISNINEQTLPLVKNLIKFKEGILNNVLNCKLYTANYPLLISHIMSEAQMYYNLLLKIENRELLTTKEIYEQELFWNNIMKEHAEFIRGLLDPSEEDLVSTANNYAKNYKMIIKSYSHNPEYFSKVSLNETINFRNFKIAGEEGILNCKIKSIIIPLLADHVVREANHFIRILESIKY